MMQKYLLFDLDGTLLPMDLDVFVNAYMKRLAVWMAPYGYDPKQLVAAVWAGTAAMVKNDGSRTNEAAFWECFCSMLGEAARQDEPKLDAFYRQDFDNVRSVCGFDPRAAQTVAAARDMGYRVVLATNPIFPAIATQKRMAWAGLTPDMFDLVTTYENSRFAKPSDGYYLDIAAQLNAKPKDCLMVGNDVTEDMAAARVGMDVFLLTDHLINKAGEDISRYPHGSFEELQAFLKER